LRGAANQYSKVCSAVAVVQLVPTFFLFNLRGIWTVNRWWLGAYPLIARENEAVAILNHNVASAYLVPSSLYAKMMDVMDDYYLSKTVDERLGYDKDDLIEVSLDDL